MEKLDILEVKVSGICNLNCRGCSHFTNITSPNIPIFYDLEKFKSDIKIIKDNIEIGDFVVTGGEPLLYKDILEVLKQIREYFPSNKIKLFTNGILLTKMGENFFPTLKDYNIEILMSLYKTTLKYKEDNENIINKYGIKYEYSHGSQGGVATERFSKIVRLNPDNNMYTCHRSCGIQKKITFLVNGKLYKCPLVANVNVLGEKYDLPQFKEFPEKYGIDIHKITNWKAAIKTLKNPEKCCKYCDSSPSVWQLGEPELSDWIVE